MAKKTGLESETCGKPSFAEILSTRVFPLGIKGFDGAHGHCSQSCPQKMCETGDKKRGVSNHKYCHIFQRQKLIDKNQ
jgi:hypothetical protein